MEKEEKPDRRPYAKPELRRVRLTPEESLALGCKLTGQSGAIINTCDNPTPCSNLDGS